MNRLINRLLPSVAVVALMLSAAVAHAVPAKRGLRQVEQPDGTVKVPDVLVKYMGCEYIGK